MQDVYFVLCPAKLEANKKARAKRGGSKIYYDKDQHRETMKDYRNYKQDLKIKGLIK